MLHPPPPPDHNLPRQSNHANLTAGWRRVEVAPPPLLVYHEHLDYRTLTSFSATYTRSVPVVLVHQFVASRGFAFVYMEDERDAEDAIHRLDRTDFGRKGRRLRVEWTKEDRSGGRKGNSKRSPNNVKPTKTLFVINFDPISTRTRDLERHFDQYGKIANIRIRRNFAFVQYEAQEDATKALDGTNGSTLMDRVISVEYALRDDDEKRNGYSPDRRGGRDRSPDRRDNRGRSASPYGRGRERGSPDYGRGRERGSPDYGRGGARASPDYVRGGSPYGGKGDDRVSPNYSRERCEASPPGYDRPRSRSPAREDRD